MGPVEGVAEAPEQERASATSSARSGLAGLIITLLVGIPVAVLLAWPQAFGAQRLPGIAQLIAFRAPLALALLLAAIVAAVLFLVLRRRARLWASIAAGMAIMALVASAANAGVLLGRGSPGTDAAGLPDGDLTVLVWNTQGGATSPADVAELILEVQADVVSLPEMDEDAAAEVAGLVALDGMRMNSATTRAVEGTAEESWIPTSLLVADDLGSYELDASAGSTPGLPSGVWRPVDGDGPAIVAAHPAPPLPESMDDWSAGLRWIADQCEVLGPDVIIAGDLNATTDHLDLGACQDAAIEARTAAVGTWPSTIPAWLASPIDHVLVGAAWSVVDAWVISPVDSGGTDHRPIVAVLVR
ncbi:endonuclease/exonuclease/phosphatase family protein [Leucobacter sp. L43]|uniref:endonuclease/exonuclease/phosphatase family protein n=1 Tax=Leucobacter sp. L43 TaxID=2798040 RepID=UPI001907038C|nr:endonuclease/exonuclease/phosphatase family protein [Leucobacter sp. L43]